MHLSWWDGGIATKVDFELVVNLQVNLVFYFFYTLLRVLRR